MKTFRRLFCVLAFTSLALTGCADAPVGDPCIPEATPTGGFLQGEAYLETSSVQCRTRVCMVYMAGQGAPATLDPSTSREQCETAMGADCSGFPSEDQIEERVYCTCRCQAPAGSDTPTCACGSGFTCVEDLLVLGGEGIRGGYCVRDTTVSEE